MKLIIAEKPSVAKSIADVIGATEKKSGYFEGNSYIVSWCVGHLVSLAMPNAYGDQYKSWTVENLPLIPQQYQYVVAQKTAPQFNVIKNLMNRNDVGELIEATDAGREGELIFRLVYNQARCKKPFKRLWISSMETSAIRSGMANLRPGSDYDNLYYAALARQQADWLVGINATRLYTAMYHRKLSIGRVQTPTLALVVQRYREHITFIPASYYRLAADLGVWRLYNSLQTDACLKDKSQAHHLADSVVGHCLQIDHIERVDKQKNAPALYDLTTLQRDANRLLGYTAKQTLDYLQSLYDQKLATYPRTDSRYLTDDMEASTDSLLEKLILEEPFAALKEYMSSGSRNVRQCINSSKVSDHHAIIPTKEVTSERFHSLPTGEKNILILITVRLFSAVSAPYIYRATKVSAVESSTATTWEAIGRETLQPGYKSLHSVLRSLLRLSPSITEQESETFPPLEEGQRYPILDVIIEDKQTSPPPLYTEDTLLSAMETAGKNLDPALRDAMKGCGLGTPATRAAIIENIIQTGYVDRNKKSLVPTATGITLIDLLDDNLKSAELTGQWEQLLSQIAEGHVSADAFISEVEAFTSATISRGKSAYTSATSKKMEESDVIGYCPLCGRPVKENSKAYGCVGYREKEAPCKWCVWKSIAGKSISRKSASEIINKKRSALIRGFTGKNGKKFDAYLVLNSDGKVEFEFPSKR